MGWFLKYFQGSEQAEFYKSRLLLIESSLKDADARLFREIARNRKREDELKAEIFRLSGLKPPLTDHSGLDNDLDDIAAHGLQVFADDDDIVPVNERKRYNEDDIRQRAKDFIDEAAKNGRPYTPEQEELVYERIKNDPEQFLSN